MAVFSDNDVRRLREVVRRVEADPRNPPARGRGRSYVAPETQWVRVTSAGTGVRAGKVLSNDASLENAGPTEILNPWTDLGDCWVREINSGSLLAIRYEARRAGDFNNAGDIRPLFEVSNGAALTFVTVAELDASPSLQAREIYFNQAQGFVVSEGFPNISAFVTITNASASTVGIVSMAAQEFAGRKTFLDGTTVDRDGTTNIRLRDDGSGTAPTAIRGTIAQFGEASGSEFLDIRIYGSTEVMSNAAGLSTTGWHLTSGVYLCQGLAGLSTTIKGLQFTGGILTDGTLSISQADVTGLTTADSPQFSALNIGHASDTTLTRSSAGNLAVEGNLLYRAGGTDVPVADGGTGASSFTAYAVLCGGTTSTNPLQSVASVGTNLRPLVSNGAGALPTFRAQPGYIFAESRVATQQSTTSATATDLTTTQHLTVNVDEDCDVLIDGFASYVNTGATGHTGVIYADVDGSDTIISQAGNFSTTALTALAGSVKASLTLAGNPHTIKLQFSAPTGGTAFYSDRAIRVMRAP